MFLARISRFNMGNKKHSEFYIDIPLLLIVINVQSSYLCKLKCTKSKSVCYIYQIKTAESRDMDISKISYKLQVSSLYFAK